MIMSCNNYDYFIRGDFTGEQPAALVKSIILSAGYYFIEYNNVILVGEGREIERARTLISKNELGLLNCKNNVKFLYGEYKETLEWLNNDCFSSIDYLYDKPLFININNIGNDVIVHLISALLGYEFVVKDSKVILSHSDTTLHWHYDKEYIDFREDDFVLKAIIFDPQDKRNNRAYLIFLKNLVPIEYGVYWVGLSPDSFYKVGDTIGDAKIVDIQSNYVTIKKKEKVFKITISEF
jgi:hypothetical protein